MSYPRNPVKRFVISIPIIGMIAFWGFRFLLGFSRLKKVGLGFIKWLIHSKEWTNYTYELTDVSQREMTGFFHVITGEDRKKLKEYLNECLDDEVLYSHVSRITSEQPFHMGADKNSRPGRRLGWYLAVRVMKPRIVVETGVDKGLGSCVIASALIKNGNEGHEGVLHNVDTDSSSGWLIESPYETLVRSHQTDSLSFLSNFDENIDIIIQDADHSYDYQMAEYMVVFPKMSNGGLIISDIDNKSSAFMDFSEAKGLKYFTWLERPKNPFYIPGGIGVMKKGDGSL